MILTLLKMMADDSRWTANFKIRRATSGDQALILRLANDLFAELGPEADSTQHLDQWPEGTAAVVAEEPGGGVIGIATVGESSAIFAGGRYGIINELYVVPGWRRRGIGRRLLEEIARIASDRRWSRVDVTGPELRNDTVREFYLRAGFSYAGPKFKTGTIQRARKSEPPRLSEPSGT